MKTDNLRCIDLICKNLCAVDQDALEQMYAALYPDTKTGTYIDGQIGGRSLQAVKIGFNRMAYMLPEISIYGAGDSLSPGRNINEKIVNLGKACEKVNYFGVSGSGQSTEIIGNIEQLETLKDCNLGKHFFGKRPPKSVEEFRDMLESFKWCRGRMEWLREFHQEL